MSTSKKKAAGKVIMSPRTPISVRQQTKMAEKLSQNTTPSLSVAPSPSYKRNIKGETPLHKAAIRGDCKRIRDIVHQYTDVDTVDNAGWTPLSEACNRGNYEAVKLLIDYQADVNFVGPNRVTPLLDACLSHHYDVVSLLVERGADVFHTDSQGRSCYSLSNENASLRQILSSIRGAGELALRKSNSIKNSTPTGVRDKENIESETGPPNRTLPAVIAQSPSFSDVSGQDEAYLPEVAKKLEFEEESALQESSSDQLDLLDSSRLGDDLKLDSHTDSVWNQYVNRSVLGHQLHADMCELFTLEGFNRFTGNVLRNTNSYFRNYSTVIAQRLTVTARERFVKHFTALADQINIFSERNFSRYLFNLAQRAVYTFRQEFFASLSWYLCK